MVGHRPPARSSVLGPCRPVRRHLCSLASPRRPTSSAATTHKSRRRSLRAHTRHLARGSHVRMLPSPAVLGPLGTWRRSAGRACATPPDRTSTHLSRTAVTLGGPPAPPMIPCTPCGQLRRYRASSAVQTRHSRRVPAHQRSSLAASGALPALSAVADAAGAQRKVGVLPCVELTSLHISLRPASSTRSWPMPCSQTVQLPCTPNAPGLELIDIVARTDMASAGDMAWQITHLGFRMALSPRVRRPRSSRRGPRRISLHATASPSPTSTIEPSTPAARASSAPSPSARTLRQQRRAV